MTTTQTVTIRWLGQQDYAACWQTMQAFTNARDNHTPDEIWLLEHFPIFTQGQNGKPEHILMPGNIPIIQTDRGGQVTYHGPGQLMVYLLVDIQRKKISIRDFVCLLERSMIQVLADQKIDAHGKREAPGVYIGHHKIGSIGLRVRRGRTYHGIAFNVAMDKEPFSRINPCGFADLKMTDLREQGSQYNVFETGQKLTHYLIQLLGYTTVHYDPTTDETTGCGEIITHPSQN